MFINRFVVSKEVFREMVMMYVKRGTEELNKALFISPPEELMKKLSDIRRMLIESIREDSSKEFRLAEKELNEFHDKLKAHTTAGRPVVDAKSATSEQAVRTDVYEQSVDSKTLRSR